MRSIWAVFVLAVVAAAGSVACGSTGAAGGTGGGADAALDAGPDGAGADADKPDNAAPDGTMPDAADAGDAPSDKDAASCAADTCSYAGACALDAGTLSCACNAGYTGPACQFCASTYVRVTDGSCLPDVACDARCGSHGTCVDEGATLRCDCDPGYSGATCGACYPGYHDDGSGACVLDQTCEPTSCSGVGNCDDSGGVVSCACPPEYAGAHCEACASGFARDPGGACLASTSCSANDPCGAHGTCLDLASGSVCTCDVGWAGSTCDTCYAGYHDDGAGGCMLDQQCAAGSCSGHGACDDTTGSVACTCDAGYSGTFCDLCASGFHRAAGTGSCDADQVCSSATCSGHGTCTVASGETTCACDTGFAGADCSVCAPGFHSTSAGCALDQTCLATTCGSGTCGDNGGVVTCTCPADRSGTYCESCATGRVDANGIDADGCECVVTSSTDVPDANGIDANCDGVDGDAATSIFVAPWGADGAPGTRSQPLRTLQSGVDLAAGTTRKVVLVAMGSYAESVTLAPGVELYGGYSLDFSQRDVAGFTTEIRGLPPTSTKPAALQLTGASTKTVIDGLTVRGADGVSPSESSYAVRIVDSTSALVVRHCTFIAGSGANGIAGTSGAQGASGSPGMNGNPTRDTGLTTSCTSTQENPGGAGGLVTCSGSFRGGDGGRATCAATPATCGPTTGASGNGANAVGGGAGGLGQLQRATCRSVSCSLIYSQLGEVPAADGADGQDGANGATGPGCSASAGTVSGGLWQPGSGSAGLAGGHGQAGGGGGAGASVALVLDSGSCSAGNGIDIGGSGGGGGSSACGGTGGGGGVGGGGSFALFIGWTTTPGSWPDVASNRIERGSGGMGGIGGTGRAGGIGGHGGLGGKAGTSTAFGAGAGGKGGHGGNGGAGAGGGGGCGGVSYGIFAFGGTPPAAYITGNTYVTAGSPGSGGPGGLSFVNAGGTGAIGASGDTNF